MMDSRNDGKFLSLKRKASEYANRLSELDSKNPYRNKAKNGGKFWDQEVDRDYAWLLNVMLKTDKQTKVNISESEDDNDKENDYGNENEHDEKDANDEDPQYCLFLENLVENGRSYKLKISKDDEPPRFLHYEEPENSAEDDDDDDLPTYGEFANQSLQDMQIVQRDEQMLHGKEGEISTMKIVSRKKKINGHKSVIASLGTMDPCYLSFLKGYNPSKGKFSYEGNEVEYEKKDKQLVHSEKQPVLAEKQPVLAEKRSSLKEKLMCILRKPYSKREYNELRKIVEEKKAICRLLPLRNRAISSAREGITKKSLLDNSPGSFRRRYEAAKEERSNAKALNLLRMFRFWLIHLPNEDILEPWLDKEIREVLPPHRTR